MLYARRSEGESMVEDDDGIGLAVGAGTPSRPGMRAGEALRPNGVSGRERGAVIGEEG